MRKIIKKLTIFSIITAFTGLQIMPASAVSIDFFNKLKKSDKTENIVQNKVNNSESTTKKHNIKAIMSDRLVLLKTQKSDTQTRTDNEPKETKKISLAKNNKSEKVVTSKTKEEKKPSFIARFKAKRQAEKDKEITVTAKTDKNLTAVKIETKDDKDQQKTKKIKTKKIKKSKAQDSSVVEQTIENTENANAENIDNRSNKVEDEKLPDNVFNASATMEGSVSTNTIVSVDDCVKIALENNPNIISQMMSKDIYKNKIAQAWANYFPTLNAGVSYSRNDMMVTNFRFPTQQYNLYNTPSLGFNALLYDFGKTGAQAGVAKKTYEASQETLQASINDIVYQVKSAYYNLLYLQQQVEVYEDAVLQYQIHLKQAQAYYEIGSKAKIDVSTAEYNLDNTKLTLVNAKNSVDNGFAQLTNAMGTPEIPPFSIKDKLDKKRYDIKFEDALKVSYESRPELIAAKKKMEGSKLLIKASKVAFLPDINAFGSYSQGGSRPDTDYGYQIGAQLAYSNINLYLVKKQLDEAKLTYKKDQADYEVQRQKVYLDVKQAFIQLKNAQQSIPVARSSMEVAKERYELAAGRYKVGLGDAIELKDAQIEFMNAKLQYYNVLMQYHISAANLERVMGAPLESTDVNL